MTSPLSPALILKLVNQELNWHLLSDISILEGWGNKLNIRREKLLTKEQREAAAEKEEKKTDEVMFVYKKRYQRRLRCYELKGEQIMQKYADVPWLLFFASWPSSH